MWPPQTGAARNVSGYWNILLCVYSRKGVTSAHPLQGGHVRPPVVVWHFAIVSGRRLPSYRRFS